MRRLTTLIVMGTISALSAASLTLDPLSDYRQLTAFPFMVHALEAGTIVAVMAGVVGWFMVLRREAFIGHTLATTSFPGASAAALPVPGGAPRPPPRPAGRRRLLRLRRPRRPRHRRGLGPRRAARRGAARG